MSVPEFIHPPARLRSKAFWSWNGQLDETVIRQQVRDMRDMGMGGFYMHARVGLQTPFLSDDWFRMVHAAVDEAQQCGLEPWIYDEDRYPSGALGGLATADPAHRTRYLLLENAPSPDCVAVYAVRRKGQLLTAYRRLADDMTLAPGESLLACRLVVEPPTDWYNGGSYLNTLDRAATDAFLRLGYQPYIDRCGQKIGSIIGGVFIDEPSYANLLNDENPPQLRWTDSLPADFLAAYGYDLLDHLPDLFLDVVGKDVGQTRYHYVKLITELFIERFMRPVADFCQQHGMRLTGHLRQEDTLRHQLSLHGSCMMALEPVHLPGIDYLTEMRRTYGTCKQASSVAHQLGREGAISETYGCTGWDFTLAEQKAMGDLQFALGITRRCLHHFFYTLAGEAKRDFPASISPFSPWWRHYAVLEDYFARLASLAEGARPIRPVAVLHPIESMWTRLRLGGFDAPENRFLDDDKVRLEDALLHAQLDFDFIDEGLLAKHGGIDDTPGSPTLQMGQAAYRMVIVPSVLTLRASTLALLQRFTQAGGVVVFAGVLPDRVDGKQGSFPADWLASQPQLSPQAAVAMARQAGLSCVHVTDDQGQDTLGVLASVWQADDAQRVFVCNTGYDEAQLREAYFSHGPRVRDRRQAYERVHVIAGQGCLGQPEVWDPFTGQAHHAPATRRPDGQWQVTLPLHPQQTWVIVFPHAERAQPRPALPAHAPRQVVRTLPDACAYTLDEPNVLVLDTPTVTLPGEPPRQAMDIRMADDLARARMGWKPHHAKMKQPWCDPGEPGDLDVTLQYVIEVDDAPAGAVHLAMEQMDRVSASLDGQAITLTPDGHWVDLSLQTAPLPAGLLTPGRHVLTLTTAYRYDSYLEAVYLLGNFGVSPSCRLTTLPATLRHGDWTAQGLKFYSGNVRCRWDLDLTDLPGDARAHLTLEQGYAGGLACVRWDGQVLGHLLGQPWEVTIPTGRQGTLEIELLGSRRNSHGPLHLCNWPFATASPWEFNPIDSHRYTPNFVTVPLGLPAAPRITITP